MAGSAPSESSTPTPLLVATSTPCPARPKPVMSVRACTGSARATSAATLFRVDICATAIASCAAEAFPVADRVEQHPRAERLRQQDGVAGLRAAVAEHGVRVYEPRDAEAVLGLSIDDRVAPRDSAPGFTHLARAPFEHGDDRLHRQVAGERGDVEGEEHVGAHGVNVVEGVGRGDLTVLERVIDGGGEEVERLHDRLVGVEPIHGRIVGLVQADQQLGMLMLRKLMSKRAHDLREGRRPVLRRSTAAGREVGQPDLLVLGHRHLLPGTRVRVARPGEDAQHTRAVGAGAELRVVQGGAGDHLQPARRDGRVGQGAADVAVVALERLAALERDAADHPHAAIGRSPRRGP